MTVTIDVMDESGVKSVALLYRHNSTSSWSNWIEVAMNHTTGNTYEALIPPFQVETTIEYRTNGTDFIDNWRVTPEGEYSYTYHVIPEFVPLALLAMLLLLISATLLLSSSRSECVKKLVPHVRATTDARTG